MVIYIAGFVQRDLKKKSKCDLCLKYIDSCTVSYGELINRKSLGWLTHPITNIYKICKLAEFETRCIKNLHEKNMFDKLMIKNVNRFVSSSSLNNIPCT